MFGAEPHRRIQRQRSGFRSIMLRQLSRSNAFREASNQVNDCTCSKRVREASFIAMKELGFDLTVTDSVINATGPKASPRIREVIANLTKHLHDFCRESLVTRSEFEAALEMVRCETFYSAEHHANRFVFRSSWLGRAK